MLRQMLSLQTGVDGKHHLHTLALRLPKGSTTTRRPEGWETEEAHMRYVALKNLPPSIKKIP